MTTARRSARILRNTLSNSVGRAVSILTTFFLTPFVLHELGIAAYGVWVLATILIGYGTLLDLGIGSAIVKYVAEARTLNDLPTGRLLVATATRMYVVLAVVGLIMGGLLSTRVTRLVDVGSVPDHDAAIVVLFLSISFAINLASTPTTATLRGLQRYDLTNALTVANVLLTAALTVLVLRAGGGLVGMVAITIPMSLATQVVAASVVRRVQPELALHWSPVSRHEVRRLSGFGATLTVGQLSILLQKRSSELIVATQLSAAAVAPFSLARRLSELPHLVSDQFIKVLLPVASELHSAQDQTALRHLYLVATRVTLTLMVPLALTVSWLAADFLELWVGANYREYADLVVLLVGASVAFTSQWPAGAIFQGMGQFGALSVAALVSGLSTVGLTLWWVGPYGLTGVAMGTLVPMVAEAALFTLPFSVRKLQVAWKDLLRQVVLPLVVPTFACAGVLWLSERWTEQASWLGMTVTSLACWSVFATIYLALPGAGEERRLAWRVLQQLARRGEREQRRD